MLVFTTSIAVAAGTFDPDFAGVAFTVIALLLGFAAVKFAKKSKGGSSTAGILMTYADGKFVRELRPNEMLIMVALVVGFGGFCIWALIHFFT